MAADQVGGRGQDADEAWRDVSALHLPAVLISLDDMVIRAVTVGGQRLVGLPANDIVGHDVADLIHPNDRSWIRASLAAIRAGKIDFYRGHPRGVRPSGEATPLVTWVRALEHRGQRLALAAWAEADDLPSPTIDEVLAQIVALLVADASGAITTATLERDVDGLTTTDLLRERVSPADDIGLVMDLGAQQARPGEAVSVAYPVSISTADGNVVSLRAVWTAFADSPKRLILLLLPDSIGTARGRELEAHLWRIATEVLASGILLRAGSLPGLALARVPETARLSPRQFEVLRRLVAGQRVPTIAAELFVSQSTVRNHLSAIFERYGVHSQPELLERLSSTDATSH